MEENEDKKPEESEPKAPEAEPEKPVDCRNEQPKEKGGKLDAIKDKAKVVKDKAKEKAKVVKQKTGEFMGVKRNRIIVLACSGAAIVALVVGLSVGLTQCHGNGGDNTSSSSSSEGSSSESKGGEGSSSSSSSSQSSSSAHAHEYGTAWKTDGTQHWHECSCGDKADVANHSFGDGRVVITPATESAPGKKAFECSVCKFTKDEVAYTPYISEADFASALKVDSDFKLRKDSYYHYTPNHKNTHDVLIQTRHGDHLKVTEDNYSYGDGFYYGGSVNWYNKIDDGEASYGFECMKYTYDETSAQWSAEGDWQWEWLDVYGVVDWTGDFTYSDFTYDETEECYKKSVRTDGNQLTETENLYFDSGKLIKRVHTEKYDYGETTTEVYEIEYSTESLALPGVGNHHQHEWSTSYSNDSLYHWHECSCGIKKDKTPHDFEGYSVTKKATKTENGTKSATCAACSGSSGEREYNPYMDSFEWNDAFASYLWPYSLKVITDQDRVGTTTEIVRYDDATLERTEMFLPTAGSGREETKYYTKGTTTYDYVIAKDSDGNWVKTQDADNHWKNSPLTVFSSYNTTAYEKDKLTLVEDGDDIHYVTEDGKVAIYFDLGRIVKLVDKTDSSTTKTITVSYSDLYEIEVPEYAV